MKRDLSEWPPPPSTPTGVDVVPRGRAGARRWAFQTRWTDPLTGHRREETRDTLTEIVEFRRRLQLARDNGALDEIGGSDLTVDEFVRLEYWPNYAGRYLERSTLRPYASIYNNHLAPHLGHIRLRRLTPRRVRDLRDLLQGNGVGDRTVSFAMSVLQGVCKFAVEAGAIKINPVRDILKPPQNRQLAIDPPSVEEIEAIRAELEHPRDRALVSILGYEGTRPGEALALRVRHVGEVSILVEQRIVAWADVKPGQKNAHRLQRSHRSPTLYTPVAADISAYLAAEPRARGAWLFPGNAAKGHWNETDWRNWSRDVFTAAADRAGVDVARRYDLRHAAAQMMLHAAIPLKDIGEHMGNTGATVSRYYTHLVAEHTGKAAVPVEDQIAAARTSRGDPMRPTV